MSSEIVYANGPHRGETRKWFGMDRFYDLVDLDGEPFAIRYVVRDGKGYMDDILTPAEMDAE